MGVDPGGRNLKETRSSAVFSACEKYRYCLTREWDPATRKLVVIGLNPSTADATNDDPTVRRCMGFARKWGLGGLHMLNLFAYRATNPKTLLLANDPVGPDNKEAVDRICGTLADCGELPLVLCAWGVHGGYMDQDETMMGWLEMLSVTPRCLGVTKAGFPRHPLYLPKYTQPVIFNGR